jgi:hypothetical protein
VRCGFAGTADTSALNGLSSFLGSDRCVENNQIAMMHPGDREKRHILTIVVNHSSETSYAAFAGSDRSYDHCDRYSFTRCRACPSGMTCDEIARPANGEVDWEYSIDTYAPLERWIA